MKKEYRYQIDDEPLSVFVDAGDDDFCVEINNETYAVTAKTSKCTSTSLSERGRDVETQTLNLTIKGQQHTAHVVSDESYTYVYVAGNIWKLERLQPQRKRSRAEADAVSGQLEAVMPSQVLEILVSEGDDVERGQTLLLLEAMKMESRITAPFASKVGQIYCQTGQVVERGQHLLDLMPHD